MRLLRAVTLCLVGALAAPAAAQQGPYPYDTWEFTLEFRRMPMPPSCAEKYGRGTLKQTKKGRNPTYILTGFPEASVIFCQFPNGGAFEIDAAWFFDLPDDGFWKGPVELMKPGDIQKVRAQYKYKGIGPFVEGTFWFETKKGRFKESGGSQQMWNAISKGARP